LNIAVEESTSPSTRVGARQIVRLMSAVGATVAFRLTTAIWRIPAVHWIKFEGALGAENMPRMMDSGETLRIDQRAKTAT
jgi:hypothetical protein